MEHKLQEAFHTLTEAELALLLTEDAAQLPSDPALTARVRQRTLEKAGLTPARKEPAMKKNNTRKHWKTLLVAAALVVLVAFSAFAVVKFALPKAMADDLSLDANTVASDAADKAVCKTNGLMIALEGVTTGKLPEGYTFNGARPTDDGCTYAIVSIRSEDGKPFWYVSDSEGYHANNFGFTLLIDGYAPNGSMFKTDYTHDGRYCYEDRENNMLYWAYDITNALCFADRGVLLQVCDGMTSGPEEIRIGKDGGFYFADGYTGVRALFELPLDPALADGEKAAAWESEACFNTYDEIVALFAAQGIDYDTIPYAAPDSNS